MAKRSGAHEVRGATPADLPAIAEIYNQEVLASIVTFDTEPWSRERASEWLEDHGQPYAVLVAERDRRIDGWASLSPFGRKPAYRWTAEDSVYVRDGVRGEGVGGALLAGLLEAGAENGIHTVIARIAAPNPASVALHERLGFQRLGIEREVGYKFDRWLDVMVMQRMLLG